MDADQTIVPGPEKASPKVPSTASAVAAKSQVFLFACRSASPPTKGITRTPSALLAATTAVQRKVAHSAFPATTPTK